MWNIRNSEREGGKLSEEKLERETNYERFLTLGNKGLRKGRWEGGWSDW